jgi:hypothetical protein
MKLAFWVGKFFKLDNAPRFAAKVDSFILVTLLWQTGECM